MDGEARLRGEVKRFRERWLADDRFRAAVAADPAAATAAAGLALDPEPLRFLWQPDVPVDTGTPEGRAYRSLEGVDYAYFDFCAADGGACEPYRAWRARQRARCAFAQGPQMTLFELHLPFAVELTRGCSLGCWFCGLSAASLEAVLPTDLDSWEDMLRALRGVFGDSAVRGFLYWATDPLDHPRYEAYGEVFRRVLGRFPATTTAAPHVDLDRTRRLMEQARAGNCPAMRFSVVTLRRLDEIHAAFSAAELADVTLVPVNRESVLGLANAGGVRSKSERWSERVDLERHKLDAIGIGERDTIACVSGFLIEPLVGRVRLISPEPSSDRRPDGYAVIDEAHYTDGSGFAAALDRMVAANMGEEPPARLALQRGVRVAARSRTAVEATGRGHVVTFQSQRRDLAALPALADAFRGGADVEQVVGRISHQFGAAPGRVRGDIATLWRHGVLIETVFDFADADADLGADADPGADVDEPSRRALAT